MSGDESDDDLTERLLDLVVYAPLGLALEAKDLLPKLAERGRGQVVLTRLAGTVAARQGQNEAGRLVDELRSSIERFLGLDDDTDDEDEDQPAGSTDDPDADADLPIDGYAGLTAVEVLPLLAGLDDAQLDQIEAFERANRARSTVLNRIRQRRS